MSSVQTNEHKDCIRLCKHIYVIKMTRCNKICDDEIGYCNQHIFYYKFTIPNYVVNRRINYIFSKEVQQSITINIPINPSIGEFMIDNSFQLGEHIYYTGEIHDGNPHGKGILISRYCTPDYRSSKTDTSNDEDCTHWWKFNGNFDHGVRKGYGELNMFNQWLLFGSSQKSGYDWSYKGEWDNNLANGKGTWSYSEGGKEKEGYCGDFKDGKFEGEGERYEYYPVVIYKKSTKSGVWKNGIQIKND